MNSLVKAALCGTSVWALTGGIALAQTTSTPPATEVARGGSNATSADDGAEELVVTGSFIRSSAFQPSSPVDVLSREQLDQRAPTSVASFLADLPYNMNSGSAPSGRGPVANTGGGAVNLRNLGDGATLVLVNSKRHTRLPREANITDVNSLIPQIAIGNIEVLRDGASALYGSDAVGGVVNLITRDTFEGLELRAQHNLSTFSGKGDTRIGGIFGKSFNNGHIVIAAEYNHRDQMFPEDLKHNQERRPSWSAPWNPARYTVPTRDAAGALRPQTRNVADMGCGDSPGTRLFLAGEPNVNADTCYYNFAPDNSAVSKENRINLFAKFKYDLSDRLTFGLEGAYTKARLYASQSTSASLTVTPPLVIPGYNPGVAAADAERVAAGLPEAFRARDASGAPLYAVPSAPGSTIPLRDANGQVVLSATPTDPSSGIAFYEDLVFNGRILGSQCGLPTGNSRPAGECARERPATDLNDSGRFVASLEGDFGSTWHWEASGAYSFMNEGMDGQRNNVIPSRLRLAFAGQGGASCNGGTPGTGSCYYFNPFNNAIFATDGTPTANRQDVIDWLMPQVWDEFRTSLMQFDLMVSGDLLQLPAGPLGIAAGLQFRRETWEQDWDQFKNVGDIDTGAIFSDLSEAQSTRAAFVELAGPLFDSSIGKLNANAAVRYEKTASNSTVDPKFGILYTAPTERRIQLRASWTTSFLSPTLYQRFTSSSNLLSISDVGPGIRGPEASRRVTGLSRGNPDLEPQTAESYSFGGNIELLPGLRFDAAYWNYSFKKLIVQENAQALVTENDPAKVIRDENNNVVFVLPSFINLGALKTSGWDLQLDYNRDFDNFGRVSLSGTATYVGQYDIQTSPTSPVVSARGNRNTRVTGAALSTNWRFNVRGSWSNGPHSVSVLYKYTGGVANDARVTAPGVVAGPENDYMSPLSTVDLTYNYNFDSLFGTNGGTITVGVNNVFETFAEKLAGGGPWTGDSRGRMAFVRLLTRF